PNKPYLEVVNIDSPLDLQKAAELANMPLDKFMKLNPGFSRASTSPDGPHRLLVPVEKVASFKTSLEQIPIYERVDQTQFFREQEERARHEEERLARAEQQRESRVVASRQKDSVGIPSKYKVRSGETLTAIASRNKTTVQALLKANPSIGKEVRSGVALNIPSNKKAEPIQWTAKAGKNKIGNVQVASAKKGSTTPAALASNKKSSANDKKPLKVALAAGKKPTGKAADKKTVNLAALTPSKSQNYRKASIAVADVATKARPVKKLKPG
ncbi:MAG: LysM peptidoglycan-binding domain-containing protein, partial [Methylococcales bacterium]|nr:LysM peptidoglycan-binding domain-containing protein [Methylococcales bacterium]